MIRALVVLLALASVAATPTPAPPASGQAHSSNSAKLTSVYNLAHVGAMLDVCAASAAGAPESARSKEIADLSTRLLTLVKAMGGHYRDKDLATIYESTKAQMASDEKLRRHVRETHQDCGEKSLAGMRTYVADNEAMIHAAIQGAAQKGSAKPAQPPK